LRSEVRGQRSASVPPMSHPNAMGYRLRTCASPLRGLNFLGMGATTRGCAPGYNLGPLRGDRPAFNTRPHDAAITPPKIHGSAPNGPRPEGAHSMLAQGVALGPRAGPFLPIFNRAPMIPLNATRGVPSMCFAPSRLNFKWAPRPGAAPRARMFRPFGATAPPPNGPHESVSPLRGDRHARKATRSHSLRSPQPTKTAICPLISAL